MERRIWTTSTAVNPVLLSSSQRWRSLQDWIDFYEQAVKRVTLYMRCLLDLLMCWKKKSCLDQILDQEKGCLLQLQLSSGLYQLICLKWMKIDWGCTKMTDSALYVPSCCLVINVMAKLAVYQELLLNFYWIPIATYLISDLIVFSWEFCLTWLEYKNRKYGYDGNVQSQIKCSNQVRLV